MNKQDKEKIKEAIKKGKWNYVFKYGIFYVGFIGGTITILLQKLIWEVKMDAVDINFTYITFIIAGFIGGLYGWRQINKKIRQNH